MSKGQGDTVYHRRLEAVRRDLLEYALWSYAGNRTKAAQALGLQRTYYGRLLRERGITYPRKEAPCRPGAS